MAGIIDDFTGAFSKRNNSLVQLLLINVAVFVFLLLLQVCFLLFDKKEYYETLAENLSLPSNLRLLLIRPWSLFTHFFVNKGFFSTFFNLLNIYFFGRIIAEYLNSRRVLNLYIYGGLAAAVVVLIAFNSIPYYQAYKVNTYYAGTTGPAFALLIATVTLLPDYTVSLFLIGPMRLKYLVLIYPIFSVVSIVSDTSKADIMGQTHFWAMIGGAIIGYSYVTLLRRGHDIGNPLNSVLDFIRSLFTEDTSTQAPQRVPVSSGNTTRRESFMSILQTKDTPISEHEIDQILDKISETGYESLNKDEKIILFKYSQKD
jgi:membrane associated rhomboid family serine protease